MQSHPPLATHPAHHHGAALAVDPNGLSGTTAGPEEETVTCTIMFDDFMDELYLSTRDLSGIAALCEAVRSPDCALATLDISGIDLGDDGASMMAKAVAASKLTSLKSTACRRPRPGS